MKSKHFKILVTAALALGGIAFIASQSVGDVGMYLYVEDMMKQPDHWLAQKNLSVHGYVVPGSIRVEIRDQKTHRTFQLERQGKIIDVRHAGVAPDTFKDQAETVVKGHLIKEGDQFVFQATEGEAGIVAKCPSKYNGQR
ncbi:MAG: cytochrome c maturation protein CcmE [Deltaproteobacteria bacterium]|nr:cytochrome c maturation protein CcmE [Deltaproteobacteria bacterium]